MYSANSNQLLVPWKNFMQWASFQAACLVFTVLSVGKASPSRTWFASLMFVFAFLSIQKPILYAFRAGFPRITLIFVILGSAAWVEISLVYAGMSFAVSLIGAQVSPETWSTILALTSTVMLQFAGLATVVAVIDELWRIRTHLEFSVEIFRWSTTVFLAGLSVATLLALLAWSLVKLTTLWVALSL